MASYTGGDRAKDRIKALEEERQLQREELERQKEAIVAASEKDALSTSAAFAERRTSANEEDLLKEAPVGLVSHKDYKARRLYRERHAAEVREKAEALKKEVQVTKVNTPNTTVLKRNNKAVLSFNASDSDSDDDDDEEEKEPVPKRRRAVVVKNPSADASFLPDRVEEEKRAAERARLRAEWRDEQEHIKAQIVGITYSYWNGTGHRRVAKVKKGTNIGRFLALAQQEFREIRHLSTDSLMFIKEDLIIPHHFTFYDFIVSKARGKSGPLFNFDVVEEIRTVTDASKEKEDAHAAKVVERGWYERNRHIFPASRWEVYDPSKSYEKYTIHG